MAETPNPPVDYSSRDYISFREDMLNAIPTRMPEWTNRSPNDFGVLLIELFAYMGDTLSFYADRIANEAFLDTAVLRSSVLSIARMLDYTPTGNIGATATLQFTIRSGAGTVTIPTGTQVSTAPVAGSAPLVFETLADLTITNVSPFTGSVAAKEGATTTAEAIGTSDGSPDQSFALFKSPVIDGSTIVSVLETGLTASQQVWTSVLNLIDSGPAANVYTVRTDENNITAIQFGDGVNGRIPPSGVSIAVTYRVGGGVAGNVGSGTLTTLVTAIANVAAVTNPSAAQGGSDAESLDEIRINAPKTLTTVDRAVTLQDYAFLALKVAGIAKAKAQSSVYTNINLYVAPYNGSASNNTSTVLKASLAAYLDTRKMVNATVTILDPTYVPINVTVAVNVLVNFGREVVRLEVEKAIRAILAFNAVGFGDRVTISKTYRAVNVVAGLDYGVISVLSRTATGLADVQLADNEIPVAGTITITATGGIV